MTLFEVGKLADEYMADFLEQLESVNQFAEGEAQRYSEHAMALLDSLKSLKEEVETDMVRGESLLSLDSATRARVLAKSYGFVALFVYLYKFTSNRNGKYDLHFFIMNFSLSHPSNLFEKFFLQNMWNIILHLFQREFPFKWLDC